MGPYILSASLIIVTSLIFYTLIMGYLYIFLQNKLSKWCLYNDSPFLSSFLGAVIYLVIKLTLLLTGTEISDVLDVAIFILCVGGVNIALSPEKTKGRWKKWLIPVFFPTVVILIIFFFIIFFLYLK